MTHYLSAPILAALAITIILLMLDGLSDVVVTVFALWEKNKPPVIFRGIAPNAAFLLAAAGQRHQRHDRRHRRTDRHAAARATDPQRI
jgi:hypothetical protein